MNNLLFTALIIALIYYCFYYRPSQKKLANLPLKHNRAVQTELDTEELEALKKDNQQKEQEIDELKSQIRELVKRPLKPTNSKSVQTSDSELTNALDTLIKDIQELNQELN